MSLVNLKGYSLDQIKQFVKQIGMPEYRAKQIFKWIYKGQTDFDKMTDIPKEVRAELKQNAYIGKIDIWAKYASRDKTVKYVFLLEDGNIVESVKMDYSFGTTACISSQVGCPMGCAFCASAEGGVVRNLTCGEMVDEVLSIEKDGKEKISRVVVMGSGEPLLNYDELIKFIKIMNDPLAFNISLRKLTVSTCGIIPGIYRLAEERMPINLAVSLHAPNDKLRNMLMPVNRRYSVLQLLDACKYYIIKTKRRITFEYALISKINDTEECARQLARLLKGILCHVNLITLNPVPGKDFEKSSPSQMQRFKKILLEAGIPTTVRRKLGDDINAACGQLRRRLLKR